MRCPPARTPRRKVRHPSCSQGDYPALSDGWRADAQAAAAQQAALEECQAWCVWPGLALGRRGPLLLLPDKLTYHTIQLARYEQALAQYEAATGLTLLVRAFSFAVRG